MLPLFCFVDFGTFAEAHRWDPIQIATLPAVSMQKIHEDGGATLEQVDEFEWKCTPMPTNEQSQGNFMFDRPPTTLQQLPNLASFKTVMPTQEVWT